MLYIVANRVGKEVEDHLTDDEEEDAKDDVTQRPTILKCGGDEKDLHDDVDKDADSVYQVHDDEQTGCWSGGETSPAFESEKTHGKRDYGHEEGGET